VVSLAGKALGGLLALLRLFAFLCGLSVVGVGDCEWLSGRLAEGGGEVLLAGTLVDSCGCGYDYGCIYVPPSAAEADYWRRVGYLLPAAIVELRCALMLVARRI